MWIDLILLKKAPTECRKFERTIADVANNAQEGENIDTYRRERVSMLLKNGLVTDTKYFSIFYRIYQLINEKLIELGHALEKRFRGA